jgi:flagellar protein FliS
MSYAGFSTGVQAYNRVSTDAAVSCATPHQLVQMLYDGVLARVAAARGCMQRHQIAEKGAFVGKAISIVAALRGWLNKEAGGEIAINLESLYDYIERRLLEANAENDVTKLEEVAALVGEIKSAWDAIGPQVSR